MKINQNFLKLQQSYLFSTVNKKTEEYKAAHPGKTVIKLSIGDVTRPLCPAVTGAMAKAVAEMGDAATFRGYGPEQGYDFLKNAIAGYYQKMGAGLEEHEIFISDGAKSDVGNILDIFDKDNTVLIPDPVYPVYVDTNVMAGRSISYMNATAENGFLPLPDSSTEADLVYLCSPNNPTGAVYNKEQLQTWVDWANERHAIILFDAAYEAFITDPALPRSIFQIPGAKTCAIEFCSFSKTAGFTGTRCGYTVVPMDLVSDGTVLNKLWLRRQTTKFNGVPYIVQRGAEAVFTEEGHRQTREAISYYLENAKIIANALDKIGISYVGGQNSPYIWLACPDGMESWEYFDYLLDTAHVVGTPGAGFGKNGSPFFRLTSFGSREDVIEATGRIAALAK